MEYSLNQNVIFLAEDMLRGRLSEAEYNGITGTQRTGKVVGHFSEYFIIKLDATLPDGETAVLVPADACKPLVCHWCRDSKRVADTPFTMGQHEADALPTKDCPHCTQAVNV